MTAARRPLQLRRHSLLLGYADERVLSLQLLSDESKSKYINHGKVSQCVWIRWTLVKMAAWSQSKSASVRRTPRERSLGCLDSIHSTMYLLQHTHNYSMLLLTFTSTGRRRNSRPDARHSRWLRIHLPQAKEIIRCLCWPHYRIQGGRLRNLVH